MFKEFARPERLEQKLRCMKCKRARRHVKRTTLTVFPKILIVHLKRFKLTEEGKIEKIVEEVELANTIDFNEILAEERLQEAEGTRYELASII